MQSGFKNSSHLLLGIGLIALAAILFVELTDKGKAWWAEHSPFAHEDEARADFAAAAARPAKDAAVKIYGALGEHDVEGEGDAAPAPTNDASPQAIDRVVAIRGDAPNRLLHGRVTVKGYRTVEFEIPAHTSAGELTGTFVCVGKNGMVDSMTAVELTLMNGEQFASFSQNLAGNSVQSARPSNHGDIDWDLKATFGSAQKYYLVFRNASKRVGPAIVEANLSVKFE